MIQLKTSYLLTIMCGLIFLNSCEPIRFSYHTGTHNLMGKTVIKTDVSSLHYMGGGNYLSMHIDATPVQIIRDVKVESKIFEYVKMPSPDTNQLFPNRNIYFYKNTLRIPLNKFKIKLKQEILTVKVVANDSVPHVILLYPKI